MEEAEDSAQVHKLRSALESVDHKRRKVNATCSLIVNPLGTFETLACRVR